MNENEDIVALRQRILVLKDEVIALREEIEVVDPGAARSLNRARAALFESWTLLVGPPEDDDEDH